MSGDTKEIAAGTAQVDGRSLAFRVEAARRYSLDVAFDEAVEGLIERPLNISTRNDDLRLAARDSVGHALRSLPDPER